MQRRYAFGIVGLCWVLILLHFVVYVGMILVTGMGFAYRVTRVKGDISSAELGTTLFLLVVLLSVYVLTLARRITALDRDYKIAVVEFIFVCLVIVALLGAGAWMFVVISFWDDLKPVVGQTCDCDRTFLSRIFNAFIFLGAAIGVVELYFEVRIRFSKWLIADGEEG